MIVAARFCAGLFGTQLLSATWLLFLYGVDVGFIAPIGIAGSLFTLFCIAGTGLTRANAQDAPRADSRFLTLAQTLWTRSTLYPVRAQAKPDASLSE